MLARNSSSFFCLVFDILLIIAVYSSPESANILLRSSLFTLFFFLIVYKISCTVDAHFSLASTISKI